MLHGLDRLAARRGQGSGEPLGLSEHDAVADELLRLQAENEAWRAHNSRRRSHRQWLADFLGVLTVVAITAATLAIWTRETVYDTERFMAVVDPALDDPALSSALGDCRPPRVWVHAASTGDLDFPGDIHEAAAAGVSRAGRRGIEPTTSWVAPIPGAQDRPTLSVKPPLNSDDPPRASSAVPSAQQAGCPPRRLPTGRASRTPGLPNPFGRRVSLADVAW